MIYHLSMFSLLDEDSSFAHVAGRGAYSGGDFIDIKRLGLRLQSQFIWVATLPDWCDDWAGSAQITTRRFGITVSGGYAHADLTEIAERMIFFEMEITEAASDGLYVVVDFRPHQSFWRALTR